MVIRLFQFLYGAIKRLSGLRFAPARCYFNSSMVRLKGALLNSNAWVGRDFNSSMVRLKATFASASIVETTPFQFLYGAIKRVLYRRRPTRWKDFNSSMVRLKAIPFQVTAGVIGDFNSSMVRLKVAKARVDYVAKKCLNFNSSMVRLKGQTDISSQTTDRDFNSSMVRLKVVVPRSCSAGLLDFNSSMVRLKVAALFIDAMQNRIFQFLYGAIKSH